MIGVVSRKQRNTCLGWLCDWCCRQTKKSPTPSRHLPCSAVPGPIFVYLPTRFFFSFFPLLFQPHPLFHSLHTRIPFLLHSPVHLPPHFIFYMMAKTLLDFVGDDDRVTPRRSMELLWADAVNHLPQTDGEVFLPRNVVDGVLDLDHLKAMAIRLA